MSTTPTRDGYNLRKRKAPEKNDDSADEDYSPRKKRATTPRKPKTPKKEFSDDTDSDLKIGSQAPDFSDIEDANGEKQSLNGLLGQDWVQRLVLFFIPKGAGDKTGPEFAKLYEEYKKNGIEVVAVSSDTVKASLNYVTKNTLPFKVLSDTDKIIINAYNMQNKNGKAAKRGAIVVSKDGKVEKVYLKVKQATHAQDVLDELTGKSTPPTGDEQQDSATSQQSETSQEATSQGTQDEQTPTTTSQ
jgi:peroxiredoxin Q/BCP